VDGKMKDDRRRYRRRKRELDMITQNPELRSVIDEAERLTAQASVSKRDEQRLNFLLAKMAALRNGALAPSETRNKFFADLFTGIIETRAGFVEGTQTISYTAGQEGGYLVPQEFAKESIDAMSLVDPLLDESVVTLVRSGNGSLRPYPVPGVDLSTYEADQVGETSDAAEQTPPAIAQVALGSYTYRCRLGLSMELETDMFQPAAAMMQKIFSVGWARAIGKKLVAGNGSTAPQGIVIGSTDSGVTSSVSDGATATDIENVFYSVDAFYRNSPKCAFLMNDAAAKIVRKLVDDQHRPLVNLQDGLEYLMGRRLLISPSLPGYNASLGTQAAGSLCVFGDLSHFVVRVNTPSISRNVNAPGFAENGRALYLGLMKADAKVIDPSAGAVPPIVSARLKS
jgi:HK97 family phage major capsid protein